MRWTSIYAGKVWYDTHRRRLWESAAQGQYGRTAAQRRCKGAREAGAQVDEIVLRDHKISPCLEIYGCRKNGLCAIQDDYQQVAETLLAAQGIMLATPVFFYGVSAHTKMLVDRCQSLWVKKYWIDQTPFNQPPGPRKGLLISVGATRGKKLFDGVLLTVSYFLDVLDAALWRSLLYRGLDFENDVQQFPEYLKEARQSGVDLVQALAKDEAGGG